MNKTKKRVVLDTNIFISAVLAPGICQHIFGLWKHQVFSLVISDYILGEVLNVIARPKVISKYSVDMRYVSDLISLVYSFAEWVTPSNSGLYLSDSKDTPILDLVCTSKADFLVTGDKGFSEVEDELKQKHSCRVVSPAQFLGMLQRSED